MAEFSSVTFNFFEESQKAQSKICKTTNKIADLVSSLILENRAIKSQFTELQAVVQASHEQSQKLVEENKHLKEELAGVKSGMISLKKAEDSKCLSLINEVSELRKVFHSATYQQNQNEALGQISFKDIIHQQKNENNKESDSSSSPPIASALDSHGDNYHHQSSELASSRSPEGSITKMPARHTQPVSFNCKDEASRTNATTEISSKDEEKDCPKQVFKEVPLNQLLKTTGIVTPPRKNALLETSQTPKLLVDNKKISLAISGQCLQNVEEGEAKEFFIKHFNNFIGPFNSGLTRDFVISDITNIQKNLDSSFYLRFKNADLRDAVFLNKFCLSADAVGPDKLYLHSFLSAKEKRHQDKLLKDFYTLSSKSDGKYSFRVFPNGDSLKIISGRGNKKFLFALDSKVGPAEFLRMKGVEFKE